MDDAVFTKRWIRWGRSRFRRDLVYGHGVRAGVHVAFVRVGVWPLSRCNPRRKPGCKREADLRLHASVTPVAPGGPVREEVVTRKNPRRAALRLPAEWLLRPDLARRSRTPSDGRGREPRRR